MTTVEGKQEMAQACFLGVDVGTGSARAGVFTGAGERLAMAVEPIEIWRPESDHVEQSSDNIWSAVGQAVSQAVSEAGIAPERIHGIGFDATCSLVVLDEHGKPVTVSVSADDARNVIVWMDHRATDQAQRINAMGHDVLRYVGGRISPEMQTPKLLWLKQNMPETWRRAAHFFDLPDYLVFQATGSPTRSLCTTVCKWTYLGHEGEQGRWDRSYFQQIGLGELAQKNFARIGQNIKPMGTPAGAGLTEKAAADLGLKPGTVVSVGIIDAHAGGLGLLGARLEGHGLDPQTCLQRMALIGGTSSCHMAVSSEPQFIQGVWGPYFSAMVPKYWLTEGGQSATGALIDHVIFAHAQGPLLQQQAESEGTNVYESLNQRLENLATRYDTPVTQLTRDLHVFPDFHGNRSPRADPSLKGVIAGLTLDDSPDALALQYLATIQAIAHGTRHIIDTLNGHAYRIDTLLACGGGTKNPLFLREHADATGCRIVLPQEPEAVLLGAAVLGAVASGAYADVPEAMGAMTGIEQIMEPDPAARDYHHRRHRILHQMHEDQLRYRQIMDE